MNLFCMYCTGNDKSEIWGCEFKNCPFYIFRRCNLEWQIKEIEREKRQKIQKAKRAYKSKHKEGSKARANTHEY